jgi:two-component SAPR family response regulator
MSTITLNLPDALVKELKKRDVRDMDQFAIEAFWQKLDEDDSEELAPETIARMRESIAQLDRGEGIPMEDVFAKLKAQRAERRANSLEKVA